MRKTIVLVAAAAAFSAAPALADDCSTLMNVMIAQTQQHYSATIALEVPGQKPQTTKTVYINDTVFTQMDGKWRSMAMPAKETQDMIRNAAKTAKETCHVQGNDSVNGQAAKLYVAHVENRGSVSDNKLWVANGKVLKTEVQIQGGPHMVTVFDYANVTAPAGATPLNAEPPHH